MVATITQCNNVCKYESFDNLTRWKSNKVTVLLRQLKFFFFKKKIMQASRLAATEKYNLILITVFFLNY